MIKKALTRDISLIQINKNLIYYNEIVHPEVFKELYLKEKAIFVFYSKIILCSRPFITLLSKYEKHSLKTGDIILIRITKANTQVQFITKIYKWRKIHIPHKFVGLLNIKNHEILEIQIIAKNKDLNHNRRIRFDLSKINEIIIPRKKKYITIYAKRKIPITLPRFINLTPQLLELVCLIHGDGHYQNKLYFVSKTPELHSFVMSYFETIFKIPKTLWRSRIFTSNPRLHEENKKYWKNKLKLEESQFYKSSKSKFNTCEKGNLRIIIDYTIVSIIFKFIFYNIQINKRNAIHALNGLLYAEGGAQIGKKGLHRITLSFNKKEKIFFKEVLNQLNIKYVIQQNRNFVIQGWLNQYTFFRIFFSKNKIPFKIHPQRRNNALKGFSEHSFTKTLKKYLQVLKNNQNFTLKQISKELKIREDSVRDALKKNRYLKFVKITGKGIKGNPFKYSIRKEGLYFIKMIEFMEEKLMEEKLPFERIEREILVKRESETDDKYGKKPEERTVKELLDYGVINLNKPEGPTSHQVSDYVQKILGLKKAGHSGTLE